VELLATLDMEAKSEGKQDEFNSGAKYNSNSDDRCSESRHVVRTHLYTLLCTLFSAPTRLQTHSASSSSEDEEEIGSLAVMPAVAVSKGRRGTVVSATITVEPGWAPPVHDKSNGEKASILQSLGDIALFSALGETDKEVTETLSMQCGRDPVAREGCSRAI
jgi:hypothetical protein